MRAEVRRAIDELGYRPHAQAEAQVTDAVIDRGTPLYDTVADGDAEGASLEAVTEAGPPVPGDISVAGYDNTTFAALGPISRISVDQAGPDPAPAPA
ncbi:MULTISPECIES: ribose operon repressor [Streptomyces]|uniref:LacI family transcriptional regulator n=1 Tax=Streptomyces chartreusis NRRL 3882 TaxID=1079985 RepID=A0A2N9B1J7_STRCX|nr:MULTISPECIES: ribose operon repressor [Streptomyces]SOR77199.1 hypothetical protein SCNRRL3882_0674 [Streptomyces chartreusis NRRL 3882]